MVRASRGYTPYSRRTGEPVTRLRPTGKDDEVQVLWWRRDAIAKRSHGVMSAKLTGAHPVTLAP